MANMFVSNLILEIQTADLIVVELDLSSPRLSRRSYRGTGAHQAQNPTCSQIIEFTVCQFGIERFFIISNVEHGPWDAQL